MGPCQRIRGSALALVCLVFGASPALADRVALVIGNDRYANLPETQQLRKAVNDSKTIGETFEKLGFSVMRGENLTRQQMVDLVFAFSQRIKPGDTAALFFAGHGVAVGGANYLLPTDVRTAELGEEARVRNMAIGEADIIADIQERKAAITFVILDACRNNPFSRPGLTRSVGGSQGLTRVPEAEGVFAVYSAGFGQTALDSLGDGDASPNSVFTRVLAPKLAATRTHLADLMIDVRQDVAKIAEGIGHTQNPAYYDQTRGGRIFLGEAPAAGAASEAKPVHEAAVVVARPTPLVAPSDRQGSVGRIWHVREFKPGAEADAWVGDWYRRGSSDTFDAIHFDSRTRKYFDISIQQMSIKDRRITALRRAPRVACSYEGMLAEDGLSAKGSYGCNNINSTYQWVAKIDDNLPAAVPDDWRGQVWEQTEEGWRGTWERRGQSAIFDAKWRHPNGGFEMATLLITTDGDDVTVLRDQEKGRCTYKGSLRRDGVSITGTMQCDWSGTQLYPWKAKILR